MKKIIIPIVLAFTSTMANAEYMIKIPLEQGQGGFLPNGSIVIEEAGLDDNSHDSEVDLDVERDCRIPNGNTSWLESIYTGTDGGVKLFWEGTNLNYSDIQGNYQKVLSFGYYRTVIPLGVTEVSINQWRYTRGVFYHNSQHIGAYYYICREPI